MSDEEVAGGSGGGRPALEDPLIDDRPLDDSDIPF